MCVVEFAVPLGCMIFDWPTMTNSFLAFLAVNAILGEITVPARKQKSGGMIEGNQLGDTYATTLGGVKAQKGVDLDLV